MSTFIGPIHYWLYNKIQLQQAIVDEICSLGDRYGLALNEECITLYGPFENRPLEEMIDLGNIHAWLQERVSQVEYKYAYSVTKLLAKNQEAMALLREIAAANGRNLAVVMKEFPMDASGVYKVITDHLLDGMPCDHVNQIVRQNDSEILWKRSKCVHSRYWDEVGGDIRNYYELRDFWIKALVSELGFLIELPDTDIYRIAAYGAD